jgi:hypothetical protein
MTPDGVLYPASAMVACWCSYIQQAPVMKKPVIYPWPGTFFNARTHPVTFAGTKL